MESYNVTGNNTTIDLDDDLPSPEEQNPEQLNPEQSKKKKAKKSKTSYVWDSFSDIGLVDGKEKARCNGCNKEYTIGGSSGTSHMLRHIPKCVALPKFHNIGLMMLDEHGKLTSRKVDHKCIREVCAMAVIEHDLPYLFVEYRRIRELCNILNPDVKTVSIKTTLKDIYVSLLTMLVLIGSYVVKFLFFAKWTPPPHTGIELAGKVFECLKDWGIDKKIFSLTLDNASANDCMQNILKQHLSLQNSLLYGGNFFHIRCCAHILNLIVQEGSKAASSSLQKIRESIRYIRLSEARKILFTKCVEQVGGIDTNAGLQTNSPTRWNSIYVMLESALKYLRALGSLALHDKNFVTCPSSEEWKRMKLIQDFFAPFNVITTLFSGSSYPTSYLYFIQIWTIERLLVDNEDSDDDIIQDMATRMERKFDKYWSEYSVILGVASVLDPRAKFGMLNFCYKKLDYQNRKNKVDTIKEKMYELYSCYETITSSIPPSSGSMHVSSSVEASSSQFNYFGEYLNACSENENVVQKSEIDLYLNEPHLESKFYVNLDVLQYWKDKQRRYPCLSKMASDILSIPITAVASESSFSIGSRVLTKYRCSLDSENVQTLICTRNWIQGFECDDEDLDGESILDNKDSNVVDD